MGYPVSRVGNLVKIGNQVGKILTGAKAHTVDGRSGGGGVSVANGLVIMYSDADIKAMTGPDADDHPAASEPGAPPPEGSEISEETGENTSVPTDTSCDGITGNSPASLVLAPGFTLGHLSSQAVFPHGVVAQQGLSKAEIICNLKALAVNCLVPIANKYGRNSFRINSGFRKGNGKSQHQRGMAVDLQFPGKNSTEMLAIATWIRDNVPYDQLIQEKGNGIWIHVSFNRTARNQRKDVRTCPNANSSSPTYNRGLYRL